MADFSPAGRFSGCGSGAGYRCGLGAAFEKIYDGGLAGAPDLY